MKWFNYKNQVIVFSPRLTCSLTTQHLRYSAKKKQYSVGYATDILSRESEECGVLALQLAGASHPEQLVLACNSHAEQLVLACSCHTEQLVIPCTCHGEQLVSRSSRWY